MPRSARHLLVTFVLAALGACGGSAGSGDAFAWPDTSNADIAYGGDPGAAPEAKPDAPIGDTPAPEAGDVRPSSPEPSADVAPDTTTDAEASPELSPDGYDVAADPSPEPLPEPAAEPADEPTGPEPTAEPAPDVVDEAAPEAADETVPEIVPDVPADLPACVDPCDDGDPCTTGDSCVDGTCIGGAPLSCADGDPCTDDACTPGAGCLHLPADGPCDDGDPCTGGDACSKGACVDGTVDLCPACVLDGDLGCGDWKYPGSATNHVDHLACTSQSGTSGDEIYRFQAGATADVQLWLHVTGESEDCDLYLLQGDCLPSACVDASEAGAGSTEMISFTAEAGVTYYVVVETLGWSACSLQAWCL